MSPKMRKIAIAFSVVMAFAFSWWYFRMPEPSIAGLTRPTLTLMDAAGAAVAKTPIVQKPADKSNQPKANRVGVNRRNRAGVRRPGSATGAGGDNGDSLTAGGGAGNRSGFNREEWRKKRREAIEKRQNLNQPPHGPGAAGGVMGESPDEMIPPDDEVLPIEDDPGLGEPLSGDGGDGGEGIE